MHNSGALRGEVANVRLELERLSKATRSNTPSFRDAPLGAGPESILPVVVMDSGLAQERAHDVQLHIGE